MGSDQLFISTIDLPKSDYFFTVRVTFLQALVAFLSVFFVAVDTAIEDVISLAVEKIKEKLEVLAMGFGGLFCPRAAYA
jgi:hypothetical protein